MIPEIYGSEVMDALSAIVSVFDGNKDLKRVSESAQFEFVKLGALLMTKKLLDENGDMDLKRETVTRMTKIEIDRLHREFNRYLKRVERGEL